MKIAKILYLPITVVASCLLGLNNSVVNTNNINDEAVKVNANSVDTVVNYDYIATNTDNFFKIEGDDDFVVFKKSQTVWTTEIPYGAIDDFRGWADGTSDGESKTSVYRSVSWTQKADKPYITFTLGGNNANYVIVHYTYNGTTIEKKIYSNCDDWMMIPRMIKTPDEIDGDATVYVTLHDVSTNALGELIFGGLQANQTAEDAKQTIELWKKGIKKPYLPDSTYAHSYTFRLNKLAQDNEYKEAREADITQTSFNEDFENSEWLLNWTLDYSYNTYPETVTAADYPCRDTNGNSYYWSNARSDAATHANENMPYNKTGNLYFKGFHEQDKGFIAGDEYTYRIISKAFVLSSDLISVKLSGNGAQLQILDAESLDVLGTIENSAFNSTGDTKNIASSGFNSITMTRYVANVSGLKGRTVRLGMVDSKDEKADGGWQAINVDEIVTNHDLNSFKFDVDTFDQTNTDGLTTHGQITDKYVTISDSTENSISYVEEAYNFLQTYYSTLRSKENGINFCGDTAISDAVKTLLNKFNNLSDDAANIVNRSTDYNHGASATADNWYNTQTETFEVWRTIDYLMKLNNISNSHSYNPYNNVLLNNSNNNTIIITSVIVIAMTALSIGGFILLKKKRMKKQ